MFNLDQIEGILRPDAPRGGFAPIRAAEDILVASGATIVEGGTRAYYQPERDEIHLPDRGRFTKPENFYAVALHELTHWTGHPDRLARDFTGRFGTEAYAFEELIAELGSAFLNAEIGLIDTTLENHASYIDSWLLVLKRDKKAIFTAGSQAEKARKLLINKVTHTQEVAA